MDLNPVFYPKSVAIIGASSREKTVGNDVVKNLVQQGYEGKILPVNPKIDELYGVKVYHDISEVDAEIDLAVVAIPAKYVAQSLAMAAEKGAKAAVVISAGFKEVGNQDLEDDLRDTCQKHGMALIGPNCLGVLTPEISLNASFATLMPKQGNVGFISQSGALVSALLDYAADRDLGFSKFISIGNKADVQELDLIKYFFADEDTQVIAIYSESLADAPEFIQVLKEQNRGPNPKPVIILKSGRTAEGSSAIASHTGSLCSGDTAYEALFEQAGVVRAETVEEMFDLCEVFSKNKVKPVKNTTIITNAGGPGVLTTDAVIENNLELANLTEATTVALKEGLRAAASCKNPVDVLGDAKADEYRAALEAVIHDDNTDSVLFLLTPQSMTEIEETAQAVLDLKQEIDKPVIACFMGVDTVSHGVKMLRDAGIATINYPESAAKALAVFSKFANWSKQETQEVMSFDDVDQDKVRFIFEQAKAEGKTSFPEAEAMEIMKAYNFPLLRSEVATSPEEAEQIAQEIGTKLAMKIVSPDILHKSDVGGVMLNVTAANVKDKYAEMMEVVKANKPEADLQGVLLMEMAPDNGVEVILGVNQAPGLGTMVMFGLGGIYVEVLKDVKFAFAPLTKDDAQRMIKGLQTAELFEGVRGEQAKDKQALMECIGRLAQLVTDFPEIKELDINPLLALEEGQGAKVLDVRVVIE